MSDSVTEDVSGRYKKNLSGCPLKGPPLIEQDDTVSNNRSCVGWAGVPHAESVGGVFNVFGPVYKPVVF